MIQLCYELVLSEALLTVVNFGFSEKNRCLSLCSMCPPTVVDLAINQTSRGQYYNILQVPFYGKVEK